MLRLATSKGMLVRHGTAKDNWRRMEVVSASAVVGKVAAKLILKKFGKAVVERWTRHRAEQFFAAFVEALAAESAAHIESLEVDRMLDKILEDDTKTETLFDAYRRVCFTTSKDLGPRIIALLTGKLVMEGRVADEEEEKVFAAAETLGDGELLSFFKKYSECVQRASQDQGPAKFCTV
jgi:hypothetical protein